MSCTSIYDFGSDKGRAILVESIVHVNELVDRERLADVQSTFSKEAYRLEACRVHIEGHVDVPRERASGSRKCSTRGENMEVA